MSDLLSQIAANFNARPRQSMDMPEWSKPGGPVVVVYYKTPNPEALGKARAEAGANAVEFMARIVARCATNEAGERLFSNVQYKDLMTACHPVALQRLADAILALARVDVEAAEKNSDATATA